MRIVSQSIERMSCQSIALTFGVVGCIKLLDLLLDRIFVQCKRLRHDGRGRVLPDFFEDVVLIHTERRNNSYLVSRPAGIFVESWVVVSIVRVVTDQRDQLDRFSNPCFCWSRM